MLKNHKTPELQIKYKEISAQCKSAIFEYDVEREKKMLSSNNLGAFYKFVNKKLSSPSGVAPLSDPQGNLLHSDLDKANLLNDFFESTIIQDNGVLPPFPSRFPETNHDTLSDIQISPHTPQYLEKIEIQLRCRSRWSPTNPIPQCF